MGGRGRRGRDSNVGDGCRHRREAHAEHVDERVHDAHQREQRGGRRRRILAARGRAASQQVFMPPSPGTRAGVAERGGSELKVTGSAHGQAADANSSAVSPAAFPSPSPSPAVGSPRTNGEPPRSALLLTPASVACCNLPVPQPRHDELQRRNARTREGARQSVGLL